MESGVEMMASPVCPAWVPVELEPWPYGLSKQPRESILYPRQFGAMVSHQANFGQTVFVASYLPWAQVSRIGLLHVVLIAGAIGIAAIFAAADTNRGSAVLHQR